jgi:hypothetical protein
MREPPRRITDPKAAAALLDANSRRWLEPFLAGEATVPQAARELKAHAGTVYYQVRRLEGLGLLTLVRRQPRAGRDALYYRSSADSFHVPFSVTGASTLEDWLAAQDRAWTRSFVRALAGVLAERFGPGIGVTIGRDDDGGISTFLSPDGSDLLRLRDPGAPAAGSIDAVLELDFEDAKALQEELFALFERYAAKSGGGRYALRVGMAPLPPG